MYNNYEEYMREVLGYPYNRQENYENTYRYAPVSPVNNANNSELEKCYPEIYKIVKNYSDNTIRNWINKLGLPYPKKQPKKYKPKVHNPTYRVDDIVKTATRWERYLDLPQHKIARYVPNHTTEEIELYIKSFYDKFLINS